MKKKASKGGSGRTTGNVISGRGGYYTVEAAIFLPLFILAIVTVGYLIKVTACSEEIMHAAVDESRYMASRAYSQKENITFPSRLESRAFEENEDIDMFRVRDFRYLYEEDGMTGLIGFHTETVINVDLPIKMFDRFTLKDRVRLRGFIGTDGNTGPVGFDAMGRYEEDEQVWLFPRSGVRYHKEDCTFVSSSPVQTLMGPGIRSGYHPCEICDPGNVADGGLIYYFPGYGTAYHAGGCNTIDKYVVSMSKDEAVARGYTPCLKCWN